jgi:hypothetical protein
MHADLNQSSFNNCSAPCLPESLSSTYKNNPLFDCDSAETFFKIRIELPKYTYTGKLRKRKNNKIAFCYSSPPSDSSFSDKFINDDKECLNNGLVLPDNDKELKEIIKQCTTEIKALENKFFMDEHKDEGIATYNF